MFSSSSRDLLFKITPHNGILFSLPLNGTCREYDPLMRDDIKQTFLEIGKNNMKTIEAIVKLQKEMIQTYINSLVPADNESKSSINAVKVETSVLDKEWEHFHNVWTQHIHASYNINPILATHECNAQFCSLTREENYCETRETLMNSLIDYLDTYVLPVFFQNQNSSDAPFTYIAFGAGDMRYDLIVCQRLYNRGVKHLKLVVINYMRDFIPFIVNHHQQQQQADSSPTSGEGVLSLDAWSSAKTTHAQGCVDKRLIYMHKTREQFYSVLHILHQIGFESVTLHVCDDASLLLQQDPKLMRSGHVLVGMDTIDDYIDSLKTMKQFHWLASRILQPNGIASHAFDAGGFLTNVIQTLQQNNNQVHSVNDSFKKNQDITINTVNDLCPENHKILMSVERGTSIYIDYVYVKQLLKQVFWKKRIMIGVLFTSIIVTFLTFLYSK